MLLFGEFYDIGVPLQNSKLISFKPKSVGISAVFATDRELRSLSNSLSVEYIDGQIIDIKQISFERPLFVKKIKVPKIRTKKTDVTGYYSRRRNG